MLRAPLLLAGALALLLPSYAAAARRPSANGLLHVVTPEARGEAHGHPHVNVIVRFGSMEDGTFADPATFRARLGGSDITREFSDLVIDGQVVGKRAQIERGRFKQGRRRNNRMRFSVYGITGGRGRQPRDVDRVRFRVVETANVPPVAKLAELPTIYQVGVPITLDARQSYDPDGDQITVSWDLGDGTVAEGPMITHAFSVVGSPVVRLLVSDSGKNPDGSPTPPSVLEQRFCAEPMLPPGTEPGTVAVSADTALEFGVVAPGTTATRTIIIENRDERENHHVVVSNGCTGDLGAFAVSPGVVDVGPSEKVPVTVSFTPTAVGHQSAEIPLAITASNRNSLRILAHGYGGAGGGTGPTMVSSPVFYTEPLANVFGAALRAIQPDGTRFFIDNAVHLCQASSGGFSSGDPCLSDADCTVNGGTCQTVGTCFGGANDRLPCSNIADCPNGACSAAQLFEPVDLCTDGAGGVYLLSDESTFFDPNPTTDNPLEVGILRIDFDGAGNTTGKTILDRTVAETTKIACDGFAPSDDGRVYIAEFRTDSSASINCRSDKELLVSVNKRNGGTRTLLSRIDAVKGGDDCTSDFDTTSDLEASRDSRTVFAGFESGEIWRLLPTPLQFVTFAPFNPGTTVFPNESFRLHPDGSLILIGTGVGTSGGLINVYRLSEQQVAGNPLPINALTPCASVQLPTNSLPPTPPSTIPQSFTSVFSFAVGAVAPGSRDATLLVAATAGSPRLGEVLSPQLQARATLAFSLPADQSSCSLVGIVALESFDQLTM